MSHPHVFFRRAFAAAALAFSAGIAWAQATMPSDGVRLIVGFAAGGGTDVAARLVAEPLAKKLGMPVVVDNRPGGGGVVAMGELKRAAPDGRTVTGPKRAPDLPNVPTVAEAGYPAVEQAPWTAVIGPAGMSAELTARLSAALTEVLADPELRRRFAALGQEVAPRSPAETRSFVAAENARYKAIAVAARMATE